MEPPLLYAVTKLNGVLNIAIIQPRCYVEDSSG
jgi:hypothetical protein